MAASPGGDQEDPPQLRPARPDEATALTALSRAAKAVWGYSPEQLARWSDELITTPQSIERWPTVVAERGGELLAFAQIDIDRLPWRVESLWVRPQDIGRGLGTRLLRWLLEYGNSHGQALLLVDADPNALGFYQRFGGEVVDWIASPIEGDPARRRPQLLLHASRPCWPP